MDKVIAGATKYDEDKVRWDLVPYKELESVAKVMTFGAKKYADNGWKGVSKERYLAALMRHFVAYMDGEIIDPESGLPHMAHIRCNALFTEWKDNNKGRIEIPKVVGGIKESTSQILYGDDYGN